MFYEGIDEIKVPNGIATLWKYMSFEDFASIIIRSSLRFTRTDKLEDSYEGAVPNSNQSLDKKESKVGEVRRLILRSTLVNCWHENVYESDAMWKVYSEKISGVAIKTTFNRLKSSLTHDDGSTNGNGLVIGRVSYVDYRKDFIPNTIIASFFHKRKYYEHEKEVRIIAPLWLKGGEVDLYRDIGIIDYFKVDLSELIQQVVVYPFAPQYILEFIKKTASHYIPDVPILHSELTDTCPLDTETIR